MKKILLLLVCSLVSFSAYAGRTVTHQHKCPGIFRGLDICVNYVFPDYVKVGTGVPFEVHFYTWDSAYSGGMRDFVEMDEVGTFTSELMMAHTDGTHMGMPLKFTKIGKGRYVVENAFFSMSGQWGLDIDLQLPNYSLLKRASLYVYIYPEVK